MLIQDDEIIITRHHTTRLIFSTWLVTNQSVQAVNGCHQIIFCYFITLYIFCFRSKMMCHWQSLIFNFLNLLRVQLPPHPQRRVRPQHLTEVPLPLCGPAMLHREEVSSPNTINMKQYLNTNNFLVKTDILSSNLHKQHNFILQKYLINNSVVMIT